MTEQHPRTSSATAPTGPVRHHLSSEQPIGLTIRNGRGDLTVATTDGPDVIVELTAQNPRTCEIVAALPIEIIDGALQIDLPRNDLNGVTASVGDLLKAAGEGLRSGSFSERLNAGVSSLSRGVTGTIGTVDIVVSLPHRSTARLSTGAGDLAVTGRLASVHCTSGAGDVRVERIDGHGTVTTGAGDVHIGELDGDLAVKTGSGGLDIACARSGSVRAKSGVGDISIRVPDGTAVHVDATTGRGQRTVDLTPTRDAGGAEHTLEVSLTSGMGDLRVTRA